MMQRTPFLSSMLVVFTTLLGSFGNAAAAHLTAPEGLVCEYNGSLNADWDDLVGATGYVVEVSASYDVSGDGSIDRTQEFDFKAQDSALSVALQDLEAAFYDDNSESVVNKTPMTARVRVKGMHFGRVQHRDDDDDHDRRYRRRDFDRDNDHRRWKFRKLKHRYHARRHRHWDHDNDDDESTEADGSWNHHREGHRYGHYRQRSSFSQYCEVALQGTECRFGFCR